MRRTLISITLAASAMLALAAPAAAFQFTIHANHRMSPANVQRVQRAISFQVNRQVAKVYPLNPVSFTPAGGIPIYLVSFDQVQAAWHEIWHAVPGDTVGGFHRFSSTDPAAVAIIVWGTDFQDTAATISHEIIETELDPQGLNPQLEICDRVANQTYTLWGVSVAAWR